MASTKNYNEAARVIIENAGGKGNLRGCDHCMSRLRLDLKDVDKVNIGPIKDLDFSGAMINGSQLQVIAGSEIYKLYDAVVKIVGSELAGGEVEEDGTPIKKKLTPKGVVFGFFEGIARSMQACIPLLIGAGMLKGFVLIFWQMGILTDTSPTYVVLMTACNSAFYFLPIYVGFSAAKVYGGNQILGAFLGAILLHPSFVSMVGSGEAISLYGIPVRAVNYSSTVLAAYVTVWAMCQVQKFIAKRSPDNIRLVLEPFGTVVIMVPLTYWICAPIGDYMGIGLKVALEWIYTVAGPLAPAIIGALIPFLVITGTHLVLGSLAMVMLATTGVEYILMPVALLHNFVHGATSFAIGLKAKDKTVKSTGISCVFTSLIAGISEPSLYGLCLKHKAAMIGVMSGQFAGGLFFGITHTGILTMPGGGLTFVSLAVYLGADISNFINACIATVIGMAVGFVVTFVLYKDKKASVVVNNIISKEKEPVLVN